MKPVECDLHIHSNLSKSSRPEATVENCLAAARARGLKTAGFSNHCWAAHLPGANDWYRSQTAEHALSFREQIPSDTGGLRVLTGCETEFLGKGLAGMDRETAARFDYVLLPANHFHMKGFVVPENLGDGGPGAVRELLYRRFLEVTELGFGTGIVHPFEPLGFRDWEEEILSGFSRAMYETCFKNAASAGLAIEIDKSAVDNKTALNEKGYSSLYLEIFSVARHCGCRFFFGSDSHRPGEIEGYDRMAEFAGLCGIEEDMLLEL
jgi:histidinol phosphatase-like PHP family hydrolase